MDKWRLELAQIKKEFENGAFKNKQWAAPAPVECIDNGFCKEGVTQSTKGVLTMAFVNMQPLESVYSTTDAFKKGTLFPNIDKPLGEGCRV